MAAHTFAPEDALPPPKSAVIYSRDGRKRSLNIDMTKHFAPSLHDHSMPPPHPALASTGTGATPPGVARDSSSLETPQGHNESSSSSNHNGLLFGSINASHKKKKKKRSKKKALERIEESEQRRGGHNHSHQHQHQHHADCQHDHAHHHHDSGHHHHDDEDEDDEDFYSDEEVYDPETPSMASASGAGAASSGGSTHQDAPTTAAAPTSQSAGLTASKKKKKKKKKSTTANPLPSFASNAYNQHSHSHNHSHPNSSKAMMPSGHRNGHEHGSMTKHSHDSHAQNDGFWHYSDAEERQRIREFWFQLREEERRSLVRVEKEAVLKKMKEQQRHSCSCSLCGRKR